MKILLCHNYYQQPGGEDQSFASEAQMLETRGHDVIRFTKHNDAVDHMSRLTVARKSIWNDSVYAKLKRIIETERPQLMHCTNTFPLISPAAYYAAKSCGIPVVQSLRNYRLLCPNAQFLRNGNICEDCLGKSVPWPGILHGCYRGSRAASAVVAATNAVHRALRTWSRTVMLFFTLTEFARRKFIQGGLPAERIVVKPNFVAPDPGMGNGDGDYVVFVGRLSTEKGIAALLEAWQQRLDLPPLQIVGDGPLANDVQNADQKDARIRWMGRRNHSETLNIIGDAKCLVMPSIWYETFGRTIIEAFSRGVPVAASRLGAMAELVDDDRTGALFQPGNSHDLATAVHRLTSDARRLTTLRLAARHEYESKYTENVNYGLLMDVYRTALSGSSVSVDSNAGTHVHKSLCTV